MAFRPEKGTVGEERWEFLVQGDLVQGDQEFTGVLERHGTPQEHGWAAFVICCCAMRLPKHSACEQQKSFILMLC